MFSFFKIIFCSCLFSFLCALSDPLCHLDSFTPLPELISSFICSVASRHHLSLSHPPSTSVSEELSLIISLFLQVCSHSPPWAGGIRCDHNSGSKDCLSWASHAHKQTLNSTPYSTHSRGFHDRDGFLYLCSSCFHIHLAVVTSQSVPCPECMCVWICVCLYLCIYMLGAFPLHCSNNRHAVNLNQYVLVPHTPTLSLCMPDTRALGHTHTRYNHNVYNLQMGAERACCLRGCFLSNFYLPIIIPLYTASHRPTAPLSLFCLLPPPSSNHSGLLLLLFLHVSLNTWIDKSQLRNRIRP